MDNKTRIEKEALAWAESLSEGQPSRIKLIRESSYIAGATAEQELFEKWREELKRIIKWECADIVPDLKSMNKLLKLIDSNLKIANR